MGKLYIKNLAFNTDTRQCVPINFWNPSGLYYIPDPVVIEGGQYVFKEEYKRYRQKVKNTEAHKKRLMEEAHKKRQMEEAHKKRQIEEAHKKRQMEEAHKKRLMEEAEAHKKRQMEAMEEELISLRKLVRSFAEVASARLADPPQEDEASEASEDSEATEESETSEGSETSEDSETSEGSETSEDSEPHAKRQCR